MYSSRVLSLVYDILPYLAPCVKYHIIPCATPLHVTYHTLYDRLPRRQAGRSVVDDGLKRAIQLRLVELGAVLEVADQGLARASLWVAASSQVQAVEQGVGDALVLFTISYYIVLHLTVSCYVWLCHAISYYAMLSSARHHMMTCHT